MLPLFERLGIFKGFPGWSLTGSFVVVFIAAGIMRLIMVQIDNIEDNAKAQAGEQRSESSFLPQPAMKPNDHDDKSES